jgi:hypothetical protein
MISFLLMEIRRTATTARTYVVALHESIHLARQME